MTQGLSGPLNHLEGPARDEALLLHIDRVEKQIKCLRDKLWLYWSELTPDEQKKWKEPCPCVEDKYTAAMKVVNQYIPFGDCPTAIMAREIKDAVDQAERDCKEKLIHKEILMDVFHVEENLTGKK